ncbi:RING/U-box superfamily protein [Euphorbia peplus]|nr:RING/U-box superfamily protein [Euphorbia peplus]
MKWVLKEISYFPPLEQPYLVPPSPPVVQKSNLDSSSNGVFDLNDKISPSVLLIIIILAIIFFVSGLLHLLVRFLLRPGSRDPDELDSVTALQGQLQQLFHLHDSGVDQSFIDTLPVFKYKSIIGLKNPFDCAVCLCEFEDEDKLRLLPKCSHAFHMDCIDTWLLSHSTCPLCRGCLLSDLSFPPNIGASPIVLVLESGSESSREIVEGSNVICRTSSANSHLGFVGDGDLGSSRIEIPQKCEIGVDLGEKVVCIKLGKYKNVDNVGEGSGISNSNSNFDDVRRCFSMGSFEYVMDENSSLQVAIRTTPMKKQSSKKPNPGHRQAMSECDCESRRGFNGFEGIKSVETDIGNGNGNSICRSKRESFSISKIWLRGEKGTKPGEESSRRAFSFRFPRNNEDVLKVKKGDLDGRRTNSEIGIARCEINGGFDEENQNCNGKTPSFARRTLHWLVGRQNKFKM